MEKLNKTSKTYLFLFVLVLLFAFNIRLYYTQYNPVIWSDSSLYIATAQQIKTHSQLLLPFHLTGEVITQPFYPLLIAFFDIFINNLEWTAILLSLFAGVLVLFPLYFFTKHIFGEETALLTSVLVAIYPYFIFYSTYILTETLFIFLVCYMILWGYKSLDAEDNFSIGIVGVLLGFMYLTKEIGLFYAFFFSIFFSFYNYHKRIRFDIFLKKIIVFILCFLIVVGPFLLYLYNVTGEFTLSYRQGQMLKVNWNRADILGVESNFVLNEEGTDFIYNTLNDNDNPNFNFFIYLKDIPRRLNQIHKQHIPDLLPPFFIVLATIGVIFAYFTLRKKKAISYILYFIILPTTPYIFLNANHSRYFLPSIPFILIFVALGVSACAEKVALFLSMYIEHIKFLPFLKSNLHLILIILILLLSLFSVISQYNDPIVAYDEQAFEHKKAGLWLKEEYENETDSDLRIMARKPYVAYYSNSIAVLVPYEEYDRVIAYARAMNVTHLVIDSMNIPIYRPQLSFLLDTQNAPEEDLLPVYTDSETANRTIVIYEIVYDSDQD